MRRSQWWVVTSLCAVSIAIFKVVAINPATSWLVTINGSSALYHKGKIHRLPLKFLQETINNLFGINDFSPQPPVTNTTKTKSWAPRISNFPVKAEIGEDIPVLHVEKFNLDELLRINIASLYALQNKKSLFHSISDLGPYVNPSLLYVQGRWLMATGTSWSFPGMMDGLPESNTLYFKWLPHIGIAINDTSEYLRKIHIPTKNRSKKPVASAVRPALPSPHRKFLGLSNTLEQIQNVAIKGQDPRFLVVSDDLILISFTFPDRFVRTGVALLHLDHSSNTMKISEVIQAINWNNSNTEKNWVPFYFEDSTRLPNHEGNNDLDNVSASLSNALFIQQINPMVVVRISAAQKLEGKLFGRASLISEAPRGYFSYRYGELRGGTNAIDLGDRYLAIFHSSVMLPGAATKTYFLGAFTFTKSVPFRLLSISSEPIVLPWMYEGEWNPFYRNRKIDYCLFPVSLSFLPTKDIQTKVHHSIQRSTGSVKNQYEQYHPHKYRRSFVRLFHASTNIHAEEVTEDKSSPSPTNHTDSELIWNNEEDEDVSLLLTMGFQDLSSLATNLSLKELYATMEPVIYCDDTSLRQRYTDLFDFYCVD